MKNEKRTSVGSILRNPFFVMVAVLLMYVVKAIVKIHVGTSINSPMITGDGFHNVADILEALAVIAVIFVSRMPSSGDYPFGRKNIEFFASLAIGIALLVLSMQFAAQSIAGIFSYFPEADSVVRAFVPLPKHEALIMAPGTFGIVLSVTLGSVILSIVVSRYQIAIGRLTGHASLVADGEETASDSRIEFVTLGAILAEYAFHAPFVEYPLGLLVAAMIARTGWELFSRAWRVLLQHSLGSTHESEIRKICLGIPGVVAVTSLKTFQVGQTAVVMVSIATRRGSGPIGFIKYGLEHAVRSYLLCDEYKECELSVKFQKPVPERYRVAYAVVLSEPGTGARCEVNANGWHSTVAVDLAQATHLVICDVEAGAIVRTKYEKLAAALAGPPAGSRHGLNHGNGTVETGSESREGGLASYFEVKHIRDLYVFEPASEANARLLAGSKVNLLPAPSYIPETMGF